jgi:hypothetical protein
MIAPHLLLLVTIAIMTVGPVRAAEERLLQHGGSSEISPPNPISPPGVCVSWDKRLIL